MCKSGSHSWLSPCSCQGPHSTWDKCRPQLGRDLLPRLAEFDPAAVSDGALRKARKLVASEPDLLEKTRRVSMAAACLVQWLLAVVESQAGREVAAPTPRSTNKSSPRAVSPVLSRLLQPAVSAKGKERLEEIAK